ncbi:hypothetical protein AAE478_002696 [Parahypoxylon ruwenzoriense]
MTGPAGLTALKALREEGFNAVAFEKRDKVGGLWSFTGDTTLTSTLDETVCNVSKFVSGFSDYPIVKDSPPYLTSPQVAEYFNSYASHFNLQEHVHFSTTVRGVSRNASDSAWDVHITKSGSDTVLTFDKVVFGHGFNNVPRWPPMPNREPFRDKRVLVVGIGNTACEMSLALRKHTSKLYQGYRRGRMMVSRYLDNGIPMDTQYPWPTLRLKYFLENKIPWLITPLADRILISKMTSDAGRFEPAPLGTSRNEILRRAGRRLRDDWRLLPCPSIACRLPAVQEGFIPALHKQEIVPVRGFKDFVGEYRVLLDDDTVIEVDAVIFCTGYAHNFSIMPELEMDGAAGLPLIRARDESRETMVNEDGISEANKERARKPHLPRLFHMIFPPRWASSVAFLSYMAPLENVWCVCELASMSVAQVWAAETAKSAGEQPRVDGNRPPALLPSLDEMNAQVNAYQTWWRGEWQKDNSMHAGYVQGYPFYRFLHDTAGTGLYDNLDHMFTGRGWGLWWNDRELWTWLAKGPMNSYSWRLFETNPDGRPGCGRKTWPGARKALREAYENYEEFKRQAQANHEEGRSAVRGN